LFDLLKQWCNFRNQAFFFGDKQYTQLANGADLIDFRHFAPTAIHN